MMQFNIRKANPMAYADRVLIKSLHRACFPSDQMVNLAGGYWWLAYCNGICAGFCGMEQCEKWYNAGYLCRAGVAPSFQGAGLHKRLIQVRITKAKAIGWDWLITDTTENPASANGLIGKGFKMYQPAEPWAYEKSLYWRLKLTR